MMCLRTVLVFMLGLILVVPIHSDDAKNAYRRGQRAEAKNEYDAAFEAYRQAYSLKPREPKYITGYLRSRAAAASQHVTNGIKLRDNLKYQEALEEFQRASSIDGTSFVAVQEVQRTIFLMRKQAEAEAEKSAGSYKAIKPLEIEGPAELTPSPNTPITLRMTTTADNIYRTIGKLGGISVLFDLDYKPQKITVDFSDVMMADALRMVSMESKTFWRPVSSNAIFVAAEGKRKEFESNVMKTFYLRNTSNAAELQEVVGTLKGLLDISRIQVNPTHGTITVRGTQDQMVLAEKLVADIDKPKSEVVIDVAVMQVSRDRLNTLGTTVPTSTTFAFENAASVASGAGAFVKVGSLFGNSLVANLPNASFTALASDSNTKILQRPQVRALDDEKATLKIGDRVPIATGSFASGIGGGGVSPLVNTQFQYLDVGVNIDITPHIHSNHEVTLKMVLEISSVTGTQNIGGINQPVIGQRRIEHETRLQDGDINLIGGILEDSETQSLSGYPWLSQIPILKYLFGQENKDHRQTEIIFAITPHIIRAEEITDENRQLIEVGTANTIGLRYKKELKPAKADTPNSPDSPSAQKRVKPVPAARVTEPDETSAPGGAAVALSPVPAARMTEPTKTSAPEGAAIAPGPPLIRPRPSGMTSSVPTILRPSAPKHNATEDQGPSSP
jgi:general secretion pathway protein D